LLDFAKQDLFGFLKVKQLLLLMFDYQGQVSDLHMLPQRHCELNQKQ